MIPSVKHIIKEKKLRPRIIEKNDQNSIQAVLSFHLSMVKPRNYHKFTVINGAAFDREQVLSSIIKLCLPYSITPIWFNKEGEDSRNTCFLSSNCWNAIRTLCSNDLTVNILETNIWFELIIHLDYLNEEDPEASSIKSLGEVARYSMKYDKSSGSLVVNCSNFQSHHDFNDYYFRLWAPQYQKIIADVTKNLTSLTLLNLSHNQIESLVGFAKLSAPNLEEIDLSYNKINWSELIPIHEKRLKRLTLNGNPLCNVPLREYITRIKVLYPYLDTIDGEVIFHFSNLCYILKNSFIDNSVHLFVDHFLHHYFKWFLNSEGRSMMHHMYHSEAALSVSCDFRSSTENFTMNSINDLSRNILKITNYAKAVDSFKIDTTHINFNLSSFPFVELDSSTVTVDVPYYIENKVIQICFSGIFRDKVNTMYWMSFTFLLQACLNSRLREWKIINQLINVSSASQEQCDQAFKKSVKTIDTSQFETTREEILSQFKELTSLKLSMCEQFLEDTNWDMESALQSFVDQYKGDLVPEDAFAQT